MNRPTRHHEGFALVVTALPFAVQFGVAAFWAHQSPRDEDDRRDDEERFDAPSNDWKGA